MLEPKLVSEHSWEYGRNKKMCVNKSIIKCESKHCFYITNTGKVKYLGLVAD